MPVIVKIECECGGADGYRIDSDTATCWDCDKLNERILTAPNIGGKMWNNGDGDSGGIYVKQAGQRFHSEKEMVAWADSNDLEMVAPDSQRWRGIKDHNKDQADADARRDGFSTAKERSDLIKNNKKDMLARARQIKMDKYHDEHGSEDKKTLEDAFGSLD